MHVRVVAQAVDKMIKIFWIVARFGTVLPMKENSNFFQNKRNSFVDFYVISRSMSYSQRLGSLSNLVD